MKQCDFEAFAINVMNEAHDLLVGKGRDYANTANAFHNFERGAASANITREQALLVLWNKHVPAFERRLRGEELASESFRSRCVDLINYIIFALAMTDSGPADEEPVIKPPPYDVPGRSLPIIDHTKRFINSAYNYDKDIK